jgi:eukaryotic-like serine/threonine-protein kinase
MDVSAQHHAVATLDRPGGSELADETGRLVARRYRLRRRIGGAISVVWRADDQVLRRPVAMKEMATIDPEGAVARTLNEARAAASIEHPGVVRVYDVLMDDRPWLVMEMLPGQTLARTLRHRGPIPVHQVARIGVRLAEALLAVHRSGMVHRDVKPGNVQLCGADRVVLTDFGIAATAGTSPPDEFIVGSPAYISPEQVCGANLEPAADVFSLGATLYAAVEGCSAFDCSTPTASIAAVLHDPPRPFRNAGQLAPIIGGMLAKTPSARMPLEQARLALHAIHRQHLLGTPRR